MTASTPAARGARLARTGGRHGGHRDNLAGWAFVLPFVILFGLFLVWPVIFGLYLSFTGQTLSGGGSSLVGVQNYAEAFSDPDMWRAIGNTVLFTVLSVVPLVIIALVLALLVHLGLPGQWFWRLSFFLPFLLASTVVSMIWTWLYDPQLGLINDALAKFGIAPVLWLNDQSTAMIAVVITTVWWTVGFNFLLYLAALQGIPDQLYEAAALDGAGKWRQLFSVTIPQLAPTTAVITILQILASLKVFDQIYQMTNGGPAESTRSIVEYVFDAGFTGYRLGYASAISYIFLAIIVVIALGQFRFSNRRRA